jgi:hypothetical protein
MAFGSSIDNLSLLWSVPFKQWHHRQYLNSFIAIDTQLLTILMEHFVLNI